MKKTPPRKTNGAATTFRAELLKGGKTATGIQVPAEVIQVLGSGKRPPVRVTINGHTYRSSIAVMGGKFMVGVSAENRQKAQVAGGDVVDVRLEIDTEPREVELPPDFAKALKKNAAARRHFDGLSYTRRKWFVMGIEQAKTAETRQRRIEKTLDVLREGAK